MPFILGIKIDNFSKKELLRRIKEILNTNSSHYLVTPNPEIILNSKSDEELFYILNKADISLADGFGVVLAGILQGERIKRISGSDISPEVLSLAACENKKVLIINWSKGLSSSSDISSALTKQFPKLDYKIIDIEKKTLLNEKELDKVNSYAPDILFCTFGSPLQEKFIFHNLDKINNLKLALAVGGSFDFITKKTKRAPKIMRTIGLEWLWRLMRQPRRIKRIFKAVFVFSYELIRFHFKFFLYRPNVACLLFKESANGIFILLVEREDEPGHFQLPQGGLDRQNLREAGRRELEEELNTSNFKIIKSYKNLHRYRFPKMRNDELNIKYGNKSKYKGQKQGLVIAKYNGEIDDIEVNFWDHISYKWVAIDDFVNEVHEKRRKSAKIYLDKLKETLEL